MKIIIPMTGYGSRFVNAGFRELKPLIPVAGKPVLQWIVDGIYPGEKDLLFVCRQEHLDSIAGMRAQLHKIAPTAEIFAVQDWIKKGPVFDVLRASDAIDDDGPCIINYCDFYMSWNWSQMKNNLLLCGCDGCVPCYTGFHPHLLVPENFYASCLVDKKNYLVEIREKYSFAEDKTRARHSPGTYYFRSGKLLKKYARQLVRSGQELSGEYYASMIYNFMVRDGLSVWVPTDIDYLCQWGTPEDMAESVYWIELMKGIQR